jgi:outer membrane receptor protein involved in Fe transport
VVDTKASYNINQNFSIFVRVKNLFDKKYYAPSESDTLSTSIPTRGIESFAGLDITF